jgi:hypothetical protein
MLSRSAPLSDMPVGDVQLPLIEAYLDSFAPLVRPTPRIATTRTIYPSTSRNDWVHAMEMGTRDWARRKLRDHIWTTMPFDEVLARHDIHVGLPEDIVRALRRDRTLALSTDLLVQMQPGTPDFASTALALTTIATEIAPAMGWRPGTEGPTANAVSPNVAAMDGHPAKQRIFA